MDAVKQCLPDRTDGDWESQNTALTAYQLPATVHISENVQVDSDFLHYQVTLEMDQSVVDSLVAVALWSSPVEFRSRTKSSLEN